MARAKLSNALRKSYVQTAILGIIFLVALWFGPRIALRTDYPLLAVASGSMIGPYGLNIGDLIVVQGGFAGADIHAGLPPNGNMIVFHRPNAPRGGAFLFFAENELIVHRAIAKVENGGTWYFQTKGDNNHSPDYWFGPDTLNGMISSELLVGKVVAVVPWIGNVPLFMRTTQGLILIIFLFLIVLLIEYVPVILKNPRLKTKASSK